MQRGGEDICVSGTLKCGGKIAAREGEHADHVSMVEEGTQEEWIGLVCMGNICSKNLTWREIKKKFDDKS